MVAHHGLSKSDIVANVLAACEQLADKVPGGSANIKNIYIKGSDTTAVPVYVDFGKWSLFTMSPADI